ncbi:MAG: DUF47 family protein [Candidatus Riflebacteria bacterium]|nr:DUF47 family protein [Candidatus Riflebacteria bacterium]
MNRVFVNIRKLVAFLLPREERFFHLFDDMLTKIKSSVEILQKIEVETVEESLKRVDELENECDLVEAEIKIKLKGSITTPPQLSRDTILEIATTLDTVEDTIQSVSHRMKSGNGEIIKILRSDFSEFWQILEKMSEAIDLSKAILADFSENKVEVDDLRIKKVHYIENEVDGLHIACVTQKIFNSTLNCKGMVIMQVISKMEGAMDELQRFIKVIEGVIASG